VQASVQLDDASRSLGEDLKGMLGCSVHDLKDGFDERGRHRVVKQIGHGVDEDEARPVPTALGLRLPTQNRNSNRAVLLEFRRVRDRRRNLSPNNFPSLFL